MRELELEEDEDFRGYSVKEESFDPDKDFSYIDKRLQDVLGQYQRDFMCGLSAENLGARYGGYGSFLPVYQPSPSVLSHPRPSHFSSRSHDDGALPKPIVQPNESLVRRLGPSSETAVLSFPVPVALSMDFPAEHLSSADVTDDEHKHIPNNQSAQSLLKIRVKVGSENILPRDNSAIYSGLGLDMSPSSSLEDSPSEFDGASPGMQRMLEGSPSCIIEIMTSFPVPDGKFLSPLHGGIVFLMGYESNRDNARPGPVAQVVPVSMVHERSPSERKAEIIKERKARQKDDSEKVVELGEENCVGKFLSPLHGRFACLMGYQSNPQNVIPGHGQQVIPVSVVHQRSASEGKAEVIKERKVRQKDCSERAVGLGKESYDDFIDAFDPCSMQKEENILMQKEVFSTLPLKAFDAFSEGKDLTGHMRKVSVSERSLTRNEQIGVECMAGVADKSFKQPQAAKEVVMDSVSSQEAGSEKTGRMIKLKEKGQNGKRVSSIPRKVAEANETNEVGCTDSKNSLKLRGIVKHNEGKEVLDSVPFKEVCVADEKKVNRLMEKIPIDKRRVSSVQQKDSKEGGKLESVNFVATQEMKDPKSGPVEPAKGNFDLKPVRYLQLGAAVHMGKEHSFSGGKKKSMTSQNDVKTTSALSNVISKVDSSSAQMEETVPRVNFPSKNERDDVESLAELRNSVDNSRDRVDETNFRKNDNAMAFKNTPCEVSEVETCVSSSKLKEKSGGKGALTPNTGSNLRGDPSNHKLLTEMAYTSVGPRTENAMSYEEDNWVQCDCCQKWRLLPHGKHPDSLPKEWTCRMLNWLPGMNKCCFSQTETTNALLAFYQVPAPIPETQNIQPVYPSGGAVVASADAHHGSAASQLTCVESLASCVKKRHFQELNTKDQRFSGEYGNLKKLNQSFDDFKSIQMNVDANPKTKKEREADQGAFGVRKKLKQLPEHLIEDPNSAGQTAIDGRDVQKPNLSFSVASKDYAPYSSLVSLRKIKDISQKQMDFEECEIKYASGKKSKLKDQCNGLILTDAPHPKERNSLVRWAVDSLADVKENNETEQRKEGKKKSSMGLDSQETQPSCRRDTGKNNSAAIRDIAVDHNTLYKDSGVVGMPMEQHHGSNISQRALDKRKSSMKDSDLGLPVEYYKDGGVVGRPMEQHHGSRISQRALDKRKPSKKDSDLGLPAVAATSKPVQVSGACKIKVKPHQIRCSSVDSFSSSPLRDSRSDHDRDKKNVSYSHNESEDLFSVKRPNCRLENASHDTRSEQMRNEKSSTQRNLDIKSDADGEASKKMTSRKRPSGHEREQQPNRYLHIDACSKLDSMFQDEGIANGHQKLSSNDHGARSLNRLNLGKANAGDVSSKRAKLKSVPQSGGGRANLSSCSKLVSESEKGGGSETMEAVNGEANCHKQLRDGDGPHGNGGSHAITRHWGVDGAANKDYADSSSARKDRFNRSANTALKEAKDLKHSADRLKISGSGLESTKVFFQAALKFLHGASLLEPGNSESARHGEMTSIEVYSKTAKLFEYCASEYERCNDMPSAALAYKCMEVVYMQIIYSRDPVASRDRQELQMTIRTLPQVESPSSSASDIDNLNNQAATDAGKELHSPLLHGNHVISAKSMAGFIRLLKFAQDVDLAMEASRKCHSAFAAAHLILSELGNGDALSSIKRVLDFSFHDVDGLLNVVRLAMEALGV
ncbi:hypothetical protein Ancab_024181 [Ancistrocladus abbreviatus]